MEIFATIIPIFVLVALGWVAHQRGFTPPQFLGPANRLVYYLAIPALIFNSIAKASLRTEFHGAALFATLAAAVAAYATAWWICRWSGMPAARRGAFTICSGHGNLGYIGLPIAFYLLGDSGLVRAGILAGFLTILQNVLSVLTLQLASPAGAPPAGQPGVLRRLATNPVILSALGGILAAALQIPIPLILKRSLDMLSGLAPPMALLLIGSSLSMDLLRSRWRPVLGAVVIKLLGLPALGVLFMRLLHLPAQEYLPALILLATPTATVTYVLAREMHADADFAVAAISASTVGSAVTYSLWLMVGSGAG
jgi:hypothetical protein